MLIENNSKYLTSSYMVGFALGAVVFGNLADNKGRKDKFEDLIWWSEFDQSFKTFKEEKNLKIYYLLVEFN